MTNRIKIGFYVHHFDHAGTARSHERIIEAIDKTKFEVFVLYWTSGDNSRLHIIGRYPEVTLVPFERSLEKTGPEGGYTPVTNNFKEVVSKLGLSILHVGRSGYMEFPYVERIAPLQIETNIFGSIDNSGFLDKSIAICNYIAQLRGSTDAVVYNPIPPAELDGPNLRAELGIPEDAIVCGRIGRAANFHPWALWSFSELVKHIPNIYYVIVSPCQDTLAYIQNNNIPNVITLPPTLDDAYIHKFHRTIDIFSHFRSDGEVCSTAIQSAMYAKIPVVSHISPVFNGQTEVISNGGFVANSSEEYKNCLYNLIVDKNLRQQIGQNAYNIARENYDQTKVVKILEKLYTQWVLVK